VIPAPLYPVAPQFKAELVEVELVLDANVWLVLVVELVNDAVIGGGLVDVAGGTPGVVDG